VSAGVDRALGGVTPRSVSLRRWTNGTIHARGGTIARPVVTARVGHASTSGRAEPAGDRCFLLNRRRVLTKRQILQNVWRHDFRGNLKVVDLYSRARPESVVHLAPVDVAAQRVRLLALVRTARSGTRRGRGRLRASPGVSFLAARADPTSRTGSRPTRPASRREA
jgi:hypothetical protein